MRWTIVINRPSPSLNDFKGKHWGGQYRIKNAWAWAIRASPGFLSIPKATGKRRLTIERHGRAMDLDNLIGGAKCCITDNLRHLGLLVDDDPAHLDIQGRCVALPRGGKSYTVLILEDA